ncbi:MAG: RluA family pseudouridine synthase [Candidatus Cloacimonetes bacterium HGW-Cloacimonetes-1]|jgi:23S rRNA pseudouridine1911/1915/1917 synthase|nr:MAG: RluA family pseudouridine synthase [Candidatus Cloacimonetes bacterium HGW-Cloacimonetes-1]
MHSRISIKYDRPDTIRLDKYLVELKIQELYSRSFIEKLIADDRILVNNIPVKKSYPLNAEDLIEIKLPLPEPKDIVPQDIPLQIVYEDDDIAIINKAPGMIVHPGFGNPDHTLVNAIVYHFGSNLSSGKEVNRPGIVHRLDRGTSGLMIIAKNDLVQSLLSDMFAKRQIKKTYLAIACGIPDPPADSIETCISRSIANPRKMTVTDNGKWSLTHYKIIHYYHYFALLKVNIETGRMHQIRVHMAHKNYPVFGDLLYNSRRYVLSIVPENMKRKVNEFISTQMLRQALHAWRLQFTHPISGKEMDVYGDLPDDYLHTIAWLDQHFSVDNQTTDINMLRIENTGW